MAEQKCDSKLIVMESTFAMLDDNKRKALFKNCSLKTIAGKNNENINYLILK